MPLYLKEPMKERYRAIQQLIQQSHFQKAAEQATDDLIEAPKDTELLYLLAVAQRYLKRPTDAITTLNLLLDIVPNQGRAHQEAGYCHLALEDKETAQQAFKYATQANPALLTAWQQRQKLSVEGNTEESTTQSKAITEQIARLSQMPKPLLGAMDLMHEGKFAIAEQVCRQFLSKHKHHPEAMCLLAQIGAQTKVYDDATFLLESCIELYPDYYPAQIQCAELFNRLGQFHRALPLIKKYLDHHPNEELAHATLAASLVGVGEVAKGIDVYQSILQQSPNKAGIHLQLGHAFKAKGQIEQAISAYQSAYQLKPGYGDAYWSLANTKTYRFNDEELVTMQRYAELSSGDHQDRIQLCFALGKAREDNKQFERSFHFYQLGNQLKAQSNHFEPAHHEHLVDLQIQHCQPELFESRESGNPATDPIFIVGLPRAGSTLLEQILASHSQVDATMELHSILSMAMKLRGRMTNDQPAYPQNLHQLSEQQLAQLGEQFMRDTQHYRKGAAYFIDKMPNNFMHIGLIKLILPNAKIIDARREPMACCFSGFKQLFGEGQEFSYKLEHIARYYRSYEKLMAHWDKVLPGFVLRVQHEDVVKDLEGQVRRLLDFCGLPFEQNCIDFHKTQRTIQTPSSEQVRQPIYATGLAQWQQFEHYLGELKEALAAN